MNKLFITLALTIVFLGVIHSQAVANSDSRAEGNTNAINIGRGGGAAVATGNVNSRSDATAINNEGNRNAYLRRPIAVCPCRSFDYVCKRRFRNRCLVPVYTTPYSTTPYYYDNTPYYNNAPSSNNGGSAIANSSSTAIGNTSAINNGGGAAIATGNVNSSSTATAINNGH